MQKAKRDTLALVHGNRNTYMRRGCRCAECVTAYRAYAADWIKKKRTETILRQIAQERGGG